MGKLTESLRPFRIFNAYQFYAGGTDQKTGAPNETGRVFISYRPQGVGRDMTVAAWMVYRVGYKTNPDGPGYDHGNKSFTLPNAGMDVTLKERKAEALAEAQKWAGEKYGISEWAKDPYGSYGEAEFVKARVKELKAAVKEVEVEVDV